ncbi:uncharacterized protein KIAA2012 [Centropristis striata]|uniref:uncharacterized protein KIAA2012 n=1 Tax=Centropristis striata TaxID=184440 RepID=UPI0027E14CB0|nr:uncharacterized protein KIAA2012 [Centropristis striata]
MKDLSLSLLSRGCGRFVSYNKNTGRHDGRLDVCFTPQDYYIWKSQDSHLRLSNSGSLVVETESTLPKTYSTRRGPLLLYSQDLVTMEASCDPVTRDRKRRIVRQYTQQVEQQLSTLKELSAAILSYGNTQFTSSRLGPLFFPPPHFPVAPDLHHPSPPSPDLTQEQPRPELLIQFEPRLHTAERSTEQLENQPKAQEAEQSSSKKVRLDLFLQIPCTSRTPTPQREPQTWVHYAAMTPEEPEDPQTSEDRSLQLSESSQHTDINHHSFGGELHHPNMNWVHDVANDWDCSNQDSGTTSDEGNCDRLISGNRHGRTGLLPPLTVGHSVCNGEMTDRPRWNSPNRDESQTWCLPPIAESRAVQVQTQHDAQPKTDRVQFQSQQKVNRLHQQLLFLPQQFPAENEEICGKQRRGEKPERHFHKKETADQPGGGGRLPSEKGFIIQLNPGEEPPPPVGVLGCVAGRKGPGKQSSLAFLKNRLLDLQDPCESSDANRGVVRGVLPLELRDLQNGKSVGSLILGPDGEIIQLSLYESSLQDPSQPDVHAQERALQVLSADGKKLPWVIVLQPEPTNTDEGLEPNTDVPVCDVQLHHSLHKLLDFSGACSLSSHTDSAGIKTKTKEAAEAAAGAWIKEDKNNGNTEAEEEDEEEETGLFSENLQFESDASCSQQRFSPDEATTEDAEDKKRKTTERKEAEVAPASGKRAVKTVKSAAFDGQKTSRTRKDGRRQKTGSDGQPIRSQKHEGQSGRDSAQTQDQTAVKKKITGERGGVKMNEEREGVKMNEEREEESAERKRRRRRRRGRLQHKDPDEENPVELLNKDKEEISQEVEEDSNLISTSRRSATQRRKNKTKADPEEDAEQLSTNTGQHSSVQSVSSLRSQLNQRSSRRSAASSSCEAAAAASFTGLASSRGRLSSCSTVMITEEQLMLNPVKPESSRRSQQQEEQKEAAASHRAQRAERRRQEVERKRREQEEEERKQQEREQTEERMRSELDGERRRRAEELRLKKLAEEEERRRREEEEQERARREQAQREREKRRQEERRRQMEELQRRREEEEQRRRAEKERQHLEEQRRQEEEDRKLQEMDESERTEYLCRRRQEEEDRRSKEVEQRRREEEAAEEARLQAELLARQMALLQQQLALRRRLTLEAGGLEKSQGISRPWIYSYFTLLQLLEINKAKATSPDP